MLRDIFLWSVYEGYVDIAFVLLLQLKSRISAALVAAGMAHHLSSMGQSPHMRNTYKEHRAAYDEYATACIDACYKYNERLACELLLREIRLFGNITCMQVSSTQLFTRQCNVFLFIGSDCIAQYFVHQHELFRSSSRSTMVWSLGWHFDWNIMGYM
jgi:hypothetical protein